MKEQRKVIVIGAGASGFMAAITAARNGAKVTVLEHMNFTARKIEHTGNGRCNFTNRNQNISYYNSGNIEKTQCVLEKFGFEDTLKFFDELGMSVRERDGYCYPLSNQASAVSALLRMEAEHLKIKIACNIIIKEIIKENNIFKIITEGYVYESDALIIATGSKAASVTGSDGSGYDYAKAFGHKVENVYPALVSLKASGKEINILSGLRNYGRITLVIDEKSVAQEEGEIQFIKSGISGIPVFQVSRYASIVLNNANSRKKVRAVIDFLPMYDYEKLKKLFRQRLENNYFKNLTGFLTGLLHEKVISAVVLKTKIKGNVSADRFSEKQWDEICFAIKKMEFDITATGDFSQAQVCCGGVCLDELDDNLESELVRNLYFAGEIIDVDGKCGGYNLQWAWSSGFVAGRSAAKK